jgi:hypothetical protein
MKLKCWTVVVGRVGLRKWVLRHSRLAGRIADPSYKLTPDRANNVN